MAKGNYKDKILTRASIYYTWHAISIAERKSEKLWKYMNGSAIILSPNPYNLSTTATTETKNASLFIDISEVGEWLDKKEAYNIGFE